MLHIVQSQLATDMNCTVDDINDDKDSFVFTIAADNPGRRPFPRGEQHLEMLSMGRAIIVSAMAKILNIIRPQLEGKKRDDAFFMPFIYGHSLYYLPDLELIRPIDRPEGFSYELIERNEIPALYRFDGFHNALSYDVNDPRPDVIAAVAKENGRIVGIAGASIDCAMMWQVGMDVLPDCREHGLGAYLVNWLTLEILKRGYVPYYGTASSNIASQRVAHRAGYYPAWINIYKVNFQLL